jgi:transcriptional antiterminator
MAHPVFTNSVRTAKKAQRFTIIKINWLTLFKEIIDACHKIIQKANIFVEEKCVFNECKHVPLRFRPTKLINLFVIIVMNDNYTQCK